MDQTAAALEEAWTYALEHWFASLLALFFPTAHAEIDWQQPIRRRDPELQQIAPSDQLGQQWVAKLVEVRGHDGNPVLVLVHVVMQCLRDTDVAARLFRYHTRLFDRNRIPVVSLVVLADDDPGWYLDRLGYNVAGCALRFRFPTVKLADLDPGVLAATSNPIAVLTLLHRAAQLTQAQPASRRQCKVAHYRALLQQGYAASTLQDLLRLLDQILWLDPALAQHALEEMRHVEQEVKGLKV